MTVCLHVVEINDVYEDFYDYFCSITFRIKNTTISRQEYEELIGGLIDIYNVVYDTDVTIFRDNIANLHLLQPQLESYIHMKHFNGIDIHILDLLNRIRQFYLSIAATVNRLLVVRHDCAYMYMYKCNAIVAIYEHS